MIEIKTKYEDIAWDLIRKEVMEKFECIRGSWAASERTLEHELHAKLVEDIYFPSLNLLAEFCSRITIADEEDAEAQNEARP